MRRAEVLLIEPGTDAGGEALEASCRVLARGGVVAHPTETLYGLAVDPWNIEALGRLAHVKRAAPGRGFILIAASREQALRLAARPWPRHLGPLSDAFWPGPLTLILPPSGAAPPPECRSPQGIAVRVTPDTIAAALVRAFGRPLTSTSANRGGLPPARSAAEVLEELGTEVDLILDGGRRDGVEPSTLLDLTGQEPVLLRKGAVTEASIREVLSRRPHGV